MTHDHLPRACPPGLLLTVSVVVTVRDPPGPTTVLVTTVRLKPCWELCELLGDDVGSCTWNVWAGRELPSLTTVVLNVGLLLDCCIGRRKKRDCVSVLSTAWEHTYNLQVYNQLPMIIKIVKEHSTTDDHHCNLIPWISQWNTKIVLIIKALNCGTISLKKQWRVLHFLNLKTALRNQK